MPLFSPQRDLWMLSLVRVWLGGSMSSKFSPTTPCCGKTIADLYMLSVYFCPTFAHLPLLLPNSKPFSSDPWLCDGPRGVLYMSESVQSLYEPLVCAHTMRPPCVNMRVDWMEFGSLLLIWSDLSQAAALNLQLTDFTSVHTGVKRHPGDWKM